MLYGLIVSCALVQVLLDITHKPSGQEAHSAAPVTVALGDYETKAALGHMLPTISLGTPLPWPGGVSTGNLTKGRKSFSRDWMRAYLVSSQLGTGLSDYPRLSVLGIFHLSYLKTPTSSLLS